MAIDLPPQPAGTTLPNQPQDPPTLDDVIAAIEYSKRVERSADTRKRAEGPRNADHARAELYKSQVMIAHRPADAAPAWFEPTLRQVLGEVLKTELAPIKETCAQARNAQLHDGSFLPFLLLPFRNGDVPTEAPHNLPPLSTVVSIRNLTPAQATAYVQGYGLGNIHSINDRKKAIGEHIGCTIDIV